MPSQVSPPLPPRPRPPPPSWPSTSRHDNAAGIFLLDQVAEHGVGLGIDVEIVARNPQDKGFVPQPKRWRIEQTYGILILHRCLVRDYEHSPSSSASRVYRAMTHVMTRRLTGASATATACAAAQAVAV